LVPFLSVRHIFPQVYYPPLDDLPGVELLLELDASLDWLLELPVTTAPCGCKTRTDPSAPDFCNRVVIRDV
jgi:hypothetical protein